MATRKAKRVKLWRNRDLKEWFDLWNSRYFGGKLEVAYLRYGHLKDDLGHTFPLRSRSDSHSGWGIIIDSSQRCSRRQSVATLVHEMVHLEQECKYSCGMNGHYFNRRMKRLAARGAFNGIW